MINSVLVLIFLFCSFLYSQEVLDITQIDTVKNNLPDKKVASYTAKQDIALPNTEVVSTKVDSIKSDMQNDKKANNNEIKYVTQQIKTNEASTAVEIDAGVLFGDFKKEDGPFLLKGNIIVPSGQTLTLNAGCEIYVGGKNTTITVFGRINFKGTATDPVIIQSANENPNPWDWDRIYIRSRVRSTFDHCIIRHSNYGIDAENSMVTIKNTLFERNSINGLIVKNSEVRIEKSTFRKGHIVAILAQAGADITADSIRITNNHSGLACDKNSHVNMRGGIISKNGNGIIVHKGASVEIIATDITKNRVGVAATSEVPKKMREMIYKNSADLKVMSDEELKKLVCAPVGVKGVALPASKKDVKMNERYSTGFSALKEERVITTSFIGNVSLGVDYFSPTTKVHPKDLDTTITGTDTVLSAITYPQTKYPGEHGDKFYDGIQPSLIFFAQGKKGDLDVNLNADIVGNTWYDNPVNLKFNTLVLTTNIRDQHIAIGDFYENISEMSISGRKLRGIKYDGSFWDMGRGNKRLDFHLAFGESEEQEDIGEHDEDLFGDVVDTGYSIRQQLTYVAQINLKPTHFLTLFARGLIAHDQDELSLFADAIADTAVPKPLSAVTGALGMDLILLGGKMELKGELDLGTHDTVSEADYSDIAWYKPDVIPSLFRVFEVLNADSSNYAVHGNLSGTVKGFDLELNSMMIGENYFSAGNPYLESDRLIITTNARKDFSEKLSSTLKYEFERTSFSNEFDLANGIESPTNNNVVIATGNYAFGDNLPALSLDYGFRLQGKEDIGQVDVAETESTFVTKNESYDYKDIENSASIGIKQRFKNGINYSLSYKLKNSNDYSQYPDFLENDLDDTWEHWIKGNLGFRVKKIIRSKTSFKIKIKDEVKDTTEEFDWKISENFRIDIIPRKLKLTLKGDFRRKTKSEVSAVTAGVRDTYLTLQKTFEPELKYIINSKLSATLSAKVEDYDDELEGSAENYSLKVAGLDFIYLF